MENNNNLQQNILEKIKAGDIKMRSKSYFIVHLVLLIVLAILVLFTSAFLISFIMFSIHMSGRFFLLGFGWRGLGVFLLTFPWSIFLIDAVFILALEWLLKRFQFMYRSPLVYTLGGVVLVTLATGFVINATPLHDVLFHQEQRGPVPVIGGFYERIQRPPHELGVFRGTVMSLSGNTFIIENTDQDNDADNMMLPIGASSTAFLTVILNPATPASTLVATSDTVFVAGDIQGNTMHAYGIRKLLPSDEVQ
ncbi:MAG: hypothetical protein WCQ60_01745 [bacterium]